MRSSASTNRPGPEAVYPQPPNPRPDACKDRPFRACGGPCRGSLVKGGRTGSGMRMTRSARSVVLAMLLVVALGAGVTSPAMAAEYPSWDEVQEARKDSKKKADEIAKIKKLLEESKAAAAEARRTNSSI